VRETDRDAVLGSLTLFGGALSLNQAAAKYGVPRGTISRWVIERRNGTEPAKVVRLATVPPEPRAEKALASIKGRGLLTEAASDALGPAIRGRLRSSIESLTQHIDTQLRQAAAGCPADTDPADYRPPDMMQLASAGRLLDMLLSRGADLLAFDRSSQEPTTAAVVESAHEVAAEMARRRRVKSS